MGGPNAVLTKTYLCGAAIGANKLVKMGAADETVIEAVDAAAPIVGVALHATTAAGQRVDVQVMGPATVKAGGTVARGDYVTASTAGVAVASAPASGVNNSVAGLNCSKAAVVNDLFEIMLAPSQNQGQ